jgi:hypothetical protein
LRVFFLFCFVFHKGPEQSVSRKEAKKDVVLPYWLYEVAAEMRVCLPCVSDAGRRDDYSPLVPIIGSILHIFFSFSLSLSLFFSNKNKIGKAAQPASSFFSEIEPESVDVPQCPGYEENSSSSNSNDQHAHTHTHTHTAVCVRLPVKWLGRQYVLPSLNNWG